ncbi:ABC transporter, ATP-binding protein [Eubacterium nodatum ATCC 33099]|nr:ABC transporter, ATP-binding protein [Eubacterium nodatum ATCC 33099]
MIEFKNVSKFYGNIKALKNFNLTVNNGEILGLIGHNGAGKSTVIKSLVSVINPTEGEIVVDGMSLKENRVAIKEKIGYVSDSPNLFLKLSAMDYWDFIGGAYGLSDKDKDNRIKELLKIFDLGDAIFQSIESFSHGMRQKVFLIGALLANPSIWVLDEPMTGLDPQASFDLKELMRTHADKGNTVIFSTHVLQVAEQICDRIAILKKGELIYIGTIEDLKEVHPEQSLERIYLDVAGRKEENRV